MRVTVARVLTGVVALAATGLVGLGSAPPAQAAACSGSSGVTVVIDYGSLGGVVTTCAPGNPSSGLAALSGAGHAYTFVPRQPGFVCTINARPDPCNMAPTTAYWSYWHAQRGGSWTYSSKGAGSYDPAEGTVEGWAFGAGAKPGVAPPGAAPAPAPSTRTSTTASKPSTTAARPRTSTTTRSTTSSSGSAGAPAGTTRSTTAGAAPSAVAGRPTVSGTKVATAPGATAGATASASASASTSGPAGALPSTGSSSEPGPRATGLASSSVPATDGRSPWPLLLGALLLAGLAGAGTVVARRRSAADQG